MVATLDGVDDQATEPVMSCVLPSLKVPIAVNDTVLPGDMTGLAGVSAIEFRVAAVTFTWIEPCRYPNELKLLAVIFAAPWVIPVTMPAVVTDSYTVPMLDQISWFVRSCTLESLNTPIAVKPSFVP